MILRLYADVRCWEFRDDHPDEWRRMGCGAGKVGDFFVPDLIFGLSVIEACRIHDWYYTYWEGHTEIHRQIADRIFRNNMLRIIWDNTGPGLLRMFRVWFADHVYYESVRRRGAPYWFESRNSEEEYRTIAQGSLAKSGL